MFSSKSHYETLGVSTDATKDEIKKAYRKLCLQYHPDVSSSSSTTKSIHTEKFKQISVAHSILSSDIERKRYDLELNDWNQFGKYRKRPQHENDYGFGNNFHHDYQQQNGRKGNRATGSASSQHFWNKMHFLDGIYKPRNLIFGLTLGFMTLSTIKSYKQQYEDDLNKQTLLQDTRTGQKHLVEAWKNPETGQWEQPAPWSSTYQKIKPKIELVSRDLVKPAQR